MNIRIDNLDGAGPRDYSSNVDAHLRPEITRKLNQPAELVFCLLSDDPEFVVPVSGARITVGRINGKDLFSGYVMQRPGHEYLGWGTKGPLLRYRCEARSDEIVLDRKRLPDRSPFVNRTAGAALRQMTQDLLPGALDVSGIEDVDELAFYASDPQKTWSESAAEIAQLAGGSYRVIEGAVVFAPLGAVVHTLSEDGENFCPQGLQLQCGSVLRNDVTILGRVEPADHVKDYFAGDGLTTRFYLSQSPFARQSRTVFEDEYASLDATRWTVTDPKMAVSVGSGRLAIAGGAGTEGTTTVSFVELVEMGGALTLQHGQITFHQASSGLIGGLYNQALTGAGCMAGFKITPSGAQSKIQAIVNGQTGQSVTTDAGHQYALSTRLYSAEVYRSQQTFHSPQHGANQGLGGGAVIADVRVVLQIHDIDPDDPNSLVSAATVLYDGLLDSAPEFCTYCLINATSLFADISFTRMLQGVDVEVRSALPNAGFRTRLVGARIDGAECSITMDPALQFFSQYVPAENELIEVHYRSGQRAAARVVDGASIAAMRNGADDGVRGLVQGQQSPAPRTATDCENAARALLETFRLEAWSGSYETWSDFLPSTSADIFPGDYVQVNAPSRGATFAALVHEVRIAVRDMAEEHSVYTIGFANEAAEPVMFHPMTAPPYDAASLAAIDKDATAEAYMEDLSEAEVTDVSSTTMTIDAAVRPASGGGIEVRRSDYGWGQVNDRNLAGRFTTQTITLPRLARTQDYFLRQYDGSHPPRYSRHTTALHVDYPL